MYFCFDTETTGLPSYDERRQYYSPKIKEKYDSSRIVSISWIILDNQLQTIEKSNYLIKPDGFDIPLASTRIHGITTERANIEGKDIKDVLKCIESRIEMIDTLVAHNIMFDLNILRSECFRYGFQELADVLYRAGRFCTMERGRNLLALSKNPKLSALYEELYGEEMKNAHDAEFDTFYCTECFKMLKYIPQKENTRQQYSTKKRKADFNDTKQKRNHFLFYTNQVSNDTTQTNTDEKHIALNDEQMKVVYSPLDVKACLVLAVAGSGKTTTIVCRLKHLIDMGVNEHEVVLTTFTRDATRDMTKRIASIFGYEPEIRIGTIDSLAKSWLSEYAQQEQTNTLNIRQKTQSMLDVSEYGPMFLKLLKCNGKEICKNVKYMVIDEFQDIDTTQYQIIKHFYKNGVNIICVGDDAQNIYTFRGSDVKYILRFEDFFPDSQIYQLTTNYRSTPEIVAFANAAIENNEFQIPKTMVAYNDSIERKPEVLFFDRQTRETNYVKDRILELQEAHPYDTIAVISYQNSFLYDLEGTLTKYDVPHVFLDSGSDLQSKVKSGLVCLSTIHKSKGLEWDHVFMLMCNDQVFPPKKDQESINESRRLFYVAITRPRKTLTITYSPLKDCNYVSRFVSEIDKSLYASFNMRDSCYGLSCKDIIIKSKTLSQWIERLNGSFYTNLKETDDILPNLEDKIVFIDNLYQQNYDLPKFVISNYIQKDYENFLKILLMRMVGELYENCVNDENATLALGAVKLDSTEKYLYNKYRNNFAVNLDKIQDYRNDIFGNINRIAVKMSTPHKAQKIIPIDGRDRATIAHILYKLNKHANKVGVDIGKIPVFNERFLPSDFETNISIALEKFKDLKYPWRDVLWDIWEVSKCHHIIREKRRRLLYHDIKKADIEQGNMIYEDMNTHLTPILVSMGEPVVFDEKLVVNMSPNNHQNHNTMKKDHNDDIISTVDLRCGSTIITFNTSTTHNNRYELATIIKMLTDKEVYALQHDVYIDKIGILNLFNGRLIIWDVSEYDKGDILLKKIIEFVKPTNDEPT
jgi:DNA polymerase III epsilon subunit-like protein